MLICNKHRHSQILKNFVQYIIGSYLFYIITFCCSYRVLIKLELNNIIFFFIFINVVISLLLPEINTSYNISNPIKIKKKFELSLFYEKNV